MKKLIKTKKSPNFKIIGTSNRIIELNKIKSKFIVLYFYPKDDTPGCTKEAQDFNSLNKKFNKLNVRIIGISKDSIEKHVKFKKKYNLSINLVSDEDLKICKAFKVWIEKSG